LLLRALFSITVIAHLHPPGTYLYASEYLEAMAHDDEEKAEALEQDRERAKGHIQRILSYVKVSNVFLLVSGLILIFHRPILGIKMTQKGGIGTG